MPPEIAVYAEGAKSAAEHGIILAAGAGLIVGAAWITYKLVERFSDVGDSSSHRSGGFGSTERSSSGRTSMGREAYRNWR